MIIATLYLLNQTVRRGNLLGTRCSDLFGNLTPFRPYLLLVGLLLVFFVATDHYQVSLSGTRCHFADYTIILGYCHWSNDSNL